MKYYCEKCESEDVVIETVMPKQEEERRAIKDFVNPQYTITAAMQYWPQYQARCNKCGNTKQA